LNHAGVYHGRGSDPETGNDTVDGREGDLVFAERGHEDLVDEGKEDDDGDGVKVLHQIVGDAVATHLTSLGDEVAGKVAVYDPVDGVQAKDLTSDQGTFDFIDEVVIPVEVGASSNSSLVGRLGCIHFAVLDHHEDDLESVGDDGALGRSDNVGFAPEYEDACSNEKDAKAQEVSGPEVDIALQVRGCKQRERTDVDAPCSKLVRVSWAL
jgi:hypothetical protein